MPESSKDEEVQTNNGRYGWWRFTPDFLQRFVSPLWALAFCCPGPLIQGFLINGLLHYFIPTLERQFDLSSTQSGLISSGYDIAATLGLLLLAAFCGRPGAHRPRYIALGLVLLGTGAIIFSIPGIATSPVQQDTQKELCLASNHVTFLEQQYSIRPYLGLMLLFGNLLHGAGATPIYSLAVTFIDDSFPISSSSFYISIYYTMAVIGPFLGIATGGVLAHMNVNILVHPSALSDEIDATDPTWIGCWWLGFLVAGVLSYLLSVPLLGLPRELPVMKRNRMLRELMHAGQQGISFQNISDLPKGVFRLMRNLTFLFLTLAGCCEGFIFSGMAAFMTKILLQQFGQGPKNQAIFKAILGIPSSFIGMLGGGWVVKFFSMNLRQILTMIICLMSLSFPCIGALFIHCVFDDIVGFAQSYREGKLKLDAECSKNCSCDESYFFPVCGVDNRTYYSGCYAGCSQKQVVHGHNMFFNCNCIQGHENQRKYAIEGYCVSCSGLPIFVTLIFAYQTLTFFCVVPTITSVLRVVHSDVRALGVALQWIIGRLLGTIPGPLVFGKVIDESCALWQRHPDGSKGSCLHYQNQILARNLAMLIFSGKLLEIIFFIVALRLAVKSQQRRSAEPGYVANSIL